MRCLSWKKDALLRSSTEEDSDSIYHESCGRRILLSFGWRGRMMRKEKVGRRMSMCDLPEDLVGQEILTRIPITSLRAVRSTCKLWDALTKEWVLGKAAASASAVREHQYFLGFMTQDSKVCSVRFHFCRHNNKKKDFKVDLSIKQVGFLDQVKIHRVIHCDGLLLCVAQDRFMIWNPYLRKLTRWITFPPPDFHIDKDKWYARYYALGYDINRNHKILRFFYLDERGETKNVLRCEIYEFSSNSWRVFKVTPDNWKITYFNNDRMSLAVKGNNYFYAYDESIVLEKDGEEPIDVGEYFLLSFDFTTERFGPRLLPLPFRTDRGDDVAFSCLKEEKIVVQYQPKSKELKLESCSIVQIWVTNTIEPDFVSWSPFLKVEIKPYARTALGIRFCDFFSDRFFFIDEEAKVAVVIFLNRGLPAAKKKSVPKKKTAPAADAVCQHAALVIKEGGYFKPVSLGKFDKHFRDSPLMWSSSYLPSLVQLNQEED